DGIFPGRGAWEAPLRATPARMSLLLLSHGSGGDGPNLAWHAEAFAVQGWIAAAVDHPGDRFGDQTPDGRFAVWRRAPDLSTAPPGCSPTRRSASASIASASERPVTPRAAWRCSSWRARACGRALVFMPVCTLPGRVVAAPVCVDIATAPERGR